MLGGRCRNGSQHCRDLRTGDRLPSALGELLTARLIPAVAPQLPEEDKADEQCRHADKDDPEVPDSTSERDSRARAHGKPSRPASDG
jgi:hypothetical protein